MGQFFYKLFITLYPFFIKLASPFSKKAALWIDGRKDILERMETTIGAHNKLVWMHCSSLGEFEQGRPVIERLKLENPSLKVLITFFSPSGYEVRKNYDGADYTFYLPMDSRKNAARFYNTVKPSLVIFVKYEFWFYYLSEAKKRKIPALLISSIFRASQPFFSGSGHFHRHMLSCFNHIFVQNEESVALLKSIGHSTDVTLAGDTRFDRVVEIAEKFTPIEKIEKFLGDGEVVVAGSNWIEDDKELSHFVNTTSAVKFIIAPHHIHKQRLNECLRLYKNSVLYSALDRNMSAKINTVIVDNIGLLSRLYKYGTICFVGGGFGAEGVHNVLEAAVYGKPVILGPEYHKYAEVKELVATGGGISVNSALQLESTLLQLLKKGNDYREKSRASQNYVYSKRGSTEKILSYIYANRLLTN